MNYDLFSYPAQPGFKERTTSRDAAREMEKRAPRLRDQVLKIIKAAGDYGCTADEAASKLGKTEFAVRPRLTELSKMGFIRRTDQRRKNASGLNAIVWVAI